MHKPAPKSRLRFLLEVLLKFFDLLFVDAGGFGRHIDPHLAEIFLTAAFLFLFFFGASFSFCSPRLPFTAMGGGVTAVNTGMRPPFLAGDCWSFRFHFGGGGCIA